MAEAYIARSIATDFGGAYAGIPFHDEMLLVSLSVTYLRCDVDEDDDPDAVNIWFDATPSAADIVATDGAIAAHAGAQYQDKETALAAVQVDDVYIGSDETLKLTKVGNEIALGDSVSGVHPLSDFLGGAGSDDKKVKVSSNDSTPGFLLAKLDGGRLVTITEQSDGGDEDARIAVDTHASTHELGGDDIVVAQDLGSDTAADNKIMRTTGSGAWELMEAPGEAFGSQLEFATDATESTTTSSSWQTKLTLTTESLPLGSYMVIATAIISGSLSSTKIGARLRYDSDEVSSLAIKPNVADGEFPFAPFHIEQDDSGVHAISVQYRKVGGGGQARIRGVKIALYRIA